MGLYLLRRLLQSLLLLWGVLTLTFFIMHASPGHPLDRYISPRIPPATIAHLRQQFGFDQPLTVQYAKWLWQWSHFNLGYSLTQHRPVANILAEAIPMTLQLTLPVLLVSFAGGISLGTIAALYRHRWPDRLLSNGILAIYCMPSFWLGLVLILIFAVHLGWLPNAHAASIFVEERNPGAILKDRFFHLILPTVTLALPGIAVTTRYVRENLINALESSFMTLARAKGLPTGQMILHHALPHTVLALLSLLGLSLPFIFGGAFLTEIIFAWPGMGRVTLEAIFSRDYPVILATTGVSALMVIVGNLLADILYKFADPRIR